MPIAKRIVGPISLSRAPLQNDDSKFDFGQVTNNTLVAVLQQLGSLSKQAEDLFDELAREVGNTIERTSNIQGKLEHVTTKVGKLNAKEVKVRKFSYKL